MWLHFPESSTHQSKPIVVENYILYKGKAPYISKSLLACPGICGGIGSCPLIPETTGKREHYKYRVLPCQSPTAKMLFVFISETLLLPLERAREPSKEKGRGKNKHLAISCRFFLSFHGSWPVEKVKRWVKARGQYKSTQDTARKKPLDQHCVQSLILLILVNWDHFQTQHSTLSLFRYTDN